MKIKKILLPILTTGSLATVIAPAITSCSSSTLKVTATSTHEACTLIEEEAYRFIKYDSKVALAEEKTFGNDLTAFAEAFKKEYENNPAAFVDDLLYDNCNVKAKKIVVGLGISPASLKFTFTTYSTQIKYKLLPTWKKIVFFLNFDAVVYFHDVKGDINDVETFTLKFRNVPFVTNDLSGNSMSITFDPEYLNLFPDVSYSIEFSNHINNIKDGTVKDYNCTFKDYATYLNPKTDAESLGVEWINIFWGGEVSLNHIKNWKLR